MSTEPSNTNYLPKKCDIPKPIATSILQLIEVPIFSSDNYIGYGGYGSKQGTLQLIVNADDSNWNGAIIYQSQDGKNYKPLFTTTNQAISGFLLNNFLPASSLIIDNQNIIVIQLLHGRLQTVNELTLLNGANKALIGNELIQFQEAELIGSNKYKLSKLLRGRQGTEWAINNHQIGDRFIMLTDATTLIPINNNLIGRPIHYKAISIGKTLAETTPVTFTYTGKCLKPFAPVHVTAKHDENYNIIISWIRRARVDNEWHDYVDTPINKEFEKYEIDIKRDQQLVRILESSCQSVIYSKEQQLADSTVTNQSLIARNLTATI
ncbi:MULTISPECIES: hypothetical protein [unclassified Candidatus Tisiphia]|uniref:GTA baseplate fiber-binding domain-containing protein n=1 Tax=unclassified Candidatus Tisiphia TaxID=2996318 RepID=UPI00312C6D6A